MSKVRKIVFIIALIVFIIAAGYLATYYIKAYLDQKAFSNLDQGPKVEDLVTDKGIVMGKYVPLYKENKDIVGWIEIKDTKINYPVMQTKKDPQFYLLHNFKKEYNTSGTPFMDDKSDIYLPTSNWLIYGHNIKSGIMFHDLLEYQKKDFYEKHKTFRFDTIYEEGEYEIVAVLRTQIFPKDIETFKYYQYDGIKTKKEFDQYVKGIKKLSLYETKVTPKYGEQLVTLSTCAYHVKNGRFVVVGRKIEKQK